MKRSILRYTIASFALLTLASQAHAVAEGFYLGLMTGPASNSGTQSQAQVEGSSATTPVTPKSKMWGSRAYMGNKFNPYAGWELGFTFYSNIHYDTQGVDTCKSMSASVRDIDLLARGSFPFKSVEIFGKAGVALVYTNSPGPLYSPAPDKTCGDTRNATKFKPMFALGVGYDLNQSWVLDASWSRTQVGNDINSVDLYAVGISYHFVDRYCGQFLCDN